MKNILLFALLLVVFSSCQKEYEIPDLVLDTPAAGMPTGYTFVSSDDPGKAYITRFSYDDQKRVRQVVSIEVDSTQSPIKKDTFLVEKFVYTGTNSTPDYLLSYYSSVPDTTLYTYDANGKLTRDSTLSLNQNISLHRVKYNSTGFTVETKETGSPTLNDSMAISGDNLTYFRRSITGYSQYTQNVQMTYDTYENPLYAQNIRAVRFHIDLTDIGWTFYSSKNAMKTYSQSGYQSGSFTVNNSVNSAGKLTKQTVMSNTSELLRITYDY